MTCEGEVKKKRKKKGRGVRGWWGKKRKEKRKRKNVIRGWWEKKDRKKKKKREGGEYSSGIEGEREREREGGGRGEKWERKISWEL